MAERIPRRQSRKAAQIDRTKRPLLVRGEQLRAETRRPGGGGPSWQPRTPEQTYEHLAPQVERLLGEMDELQPERRAPHVVLELRLLPNFLAGSYYPFELLRSTGLYTVGSRAARGTLRTRKRVKEDEPTKTLLVAGSDDAIASLASVVYDGPRSGPANLWSQLGEIDELELPNPDEVIRGLPERYGEGEVITWEAVLSRIGTELDDASRVQLEDIALTRFRAHVEASDGEVEYDYWRRVGNLDFVPVAAPVEVIREIASFNLLRAIRPMPSLRNVPLPFSELAIASPPPPAKDARPTGGLRVAVFDGGIDPDDPYLRPFVTYHDLAPDPAPSIGLWHGTVVTNTLLYGYTPLSGALATPIAGIDHYRVWPPPSTVDVDTGAYWMLDRIVETLQASKHSIVNLSIGPYNGQIGDDAEPNRWTAELDAIAVTHGIVFVNAIGNNGQETNNRLLSPGDMANGMGVGACTSRDRTQRIIRAPYSPVGPGRAGQRVQPVGVAFGGTEAQDRYCGLGMNGAMVAAHGTSFAAPLVTHAVTALSENLGARTRPETLRAFAAHFAEGRGARGTKLTDIGYGRLPEDYERALECEPNEVTLLYQDTLNRGEVAAYYLPAPASVAEGDSIEVLWTVCYMSPIDPSSAADYTEAGLDITFRPHERIHHLYDATNRKLLGEVDILRDKATFEKQYQAGSVILSDLPVADSGWRRGRTEGELRAAGKWETLVHAAIRRRGTLLFRPRLDIEYMARRAGMLVKPKDALPLDLTILVTLRAPTSIALYESVRAEYPVLVELQADLAVRAAVSAVPVRV